MIVGSEGSLLLVQRHCALLLPCKPMCNVIKGRYDACVICDRCRAQHPL